jgi:hypothetical protein
MLKVKRGPFGMLFRHHGRLCVGIFGRINSECEDQMDF